MSKIQILPANNNGIETAITLLRDGELVAIPTETVYGLGADATNGTAVAKIFKAKSRPQFNPLITHITDFKAALLYGEYDKRAEILAQTFWPGALTLILKRRADCPLSELVSAGLETIALRAPSHPIAQQLLKQSGIAIAAPSANKSGTISPTTPTHVIDSLGENAPPILAGGKSDLGLESTILDLSSDTATLLRSGAISQSDIEELIGKIETSFHIIDDEQPKSPGQLLKHYAPSTPLRLNAVDIHKDEALLGFGSLKFMGVKEGGFAHELPEDQVLNLSPIGDLTEAASNLFSMMHQLDKAGFKHIAVMPIPNTELGIAINDRLSRAAEKD